MGRKTQGVQDLVEDILTHLRAPYGEDIIEDVFLFIESNQGIMQRYRALEAELGQLVVNSWIGQYTKQLTGMHSVREVRAKRSQLIKDYTKLSPHSV